MRTTKTKIRGRIYLIESGSGLIKGEAEIVDCFDKISLESAQLNFIKHQVDNFDLLNKWCYPWVLKNVKAYKKPIPYKHPKGAVIWVNLENIDEST